MHLARFPGRYYNSALYTAYGQGKENMGPNTQSKSSRQTRVAVVVPTWNERDNIGVLIPQLAEVLQPYDYQIVVVDDGSPDGTGDVVREHSRADPRVVLVQRAGKAGLASAVLAGAKASQGEIVVMMDADLSHDPKTVPALIEKVAGGSDVAVGSRYMTGGGSADWPWIRRLMSWTATTFARMLLWPGTRDPMSGFAAYRREILLGLTTRYSARGFKLLLEVLVTRAPLRVAEVPIVFTQRQKGTSKMGARELLEFLALCLRLFVWKLRRKFMGRDASAA